MYEQLDFINLKNRRADLQRELREAQLAKEAAQGERKPNRLLAVILGVLTNIIR